MDEQLAKRLNALTKQNDLLSKARGAYLLKEAERKNFEATLIKDAPGKSHAEKTNAAQALAFWRQFHKELAILENDYEFQKLKYEILDKAYLAEHLSLKLDSSEIKRQV